MISRKESIPIVLIIWIKIHGDTVYDQSLHFRNIHIQMLEFVPFSLLNHINNVRNVYIILNTIRFESYTWEPLLTKTFIDKDYWYKEIFIMFNQDICIPTVKSLIKDAPIPKTLLFLVPSCSCLCASYWSQVLSRECRCSWSSADRRCSNYIWVINNLMATKVRLILETWRYVSFPKCPYIFATIYSLSNVMTMADIKETHKPIND